MPPGATITLMTASTPEACIAQTRAWVDLAVIGLNLCPFAKAVQSKGALDYVVSPATTPEALLADLHTELLRLRDAPIDVLESTLLVHPGVLTDFTDYNDFLDLADMALEELDLDGVLQVASFHPDYRFDGTRADDVTNASNQSPWPTLHLLREESVDRAVAAFPDAEAIFEANIETLRALGPGGWAALRARWKAL